MGTRWSLFCTMNAEKNKVWLFAIVDNEIAAVQVFKNHIVIFDERHIPFIFMTPTIDGETVAQYPVSCLDGRINYYRQPVESG